MRHVSVAPGVGSIAVAERSASNEADSGRWRTSSVRTKFATPQTKGPERGPSDFSRRSIAGTACYFFAGVAGAGEAGAGVAAGVEDAGAGGASEFHVSRMMSHFPPLFL